MPPLPPLAAASPPPPRPRAAPIAARWRAAAGGTLLAAGAVSRADWRKQERCAGQTPFLLFYRCWGVKTVRKCVQAT